MTYLSRRFAPRLLLAATLVLAPAAHAGRTHAEPAAATSAASPAPLAPLAARFAETRRDGHGHAVTNDWFFYREGDHIETAQRDYAEVWQRDDRQAVTLRRVFHGERKIVEYTTGELRTQHRLKDWRELGSILDARTLSRLRRVGTDTVLKQPAVRYVGHSGDTRIEVLWLPRLNLPARIVRSTPQSRYSLVLRELLPAAAAAWPRVDAAATADFEIIDGSDLGDREYDPFVRKVLSMDTGEHRHAH